MNHLDELAFRKFAKEITQEERELMIKAYKEVVKRLDNLTGKAGRHKK